MAFLEYIKTLPVILFYGLSLVTVLVGDFYAKKWSLDPKLGYSIITAFGYMLSGIFYLPVLLIKGSLVITAMTWMILNILGFIIIGVILYKESLSPMHIAGLIFGVVSVVILNLGHE